MRTSERVLKWALRLYPPLFFQRIWIKKIENGFTGASAVIYKSILNSNYNRSIFGGTIFCGADPLFPTLIYQNLIRKGYQPLIWLKHSEVDYLYPGTSNLYLSVKLSKEDLEEICEGLETTGKFVKTYPIQLLDKDQRVCVMVRNEIYIRLIRSQTKKGEKD